VYDPLSPLRDSSLTLDKIQKCTREVIKNLLTVALFLYLNAPHSLRNVLRWSFTSLLLLVKFY